MLRLPAGPTSVGQQGDGGRAGHLAGRHFRRLTDPREFAPTDQRQFALTSGEHRLGRLDLHVRRPQGGVSPDDRSDQAESDLLGGVVGGEQLGPGDFLGPAQLPQKSNSNDVVKPPRSVRRLRPAAVPPTGT